MNALNLIGEIFKPAAKLIDDLHTSEEEKLEQKAILLQLQTDFLTKGLLYEQEQLKAKAEIITAEAKSGHWLTSTWRPVTMLTFVALLVATWMGWTANIDLELQMELMSIVKIGLGGYVIGRSAEKTAAPLVEAFKKREQS